MFNRDLYLLLVSDPDFDIKDFFNELNTHTKTARVCSFQLWWSLSFFCQMSINA